MNLLRNLLLLLLLASTSTYAEELTIIPLQHRLADQVLPTIQPLLAPGGYLAGADSQLFIKTTPENLQEIKAALAALDKPLRRLLISVSTQGGAVLQSQGYGIDSISTNGEQVAISGHEGTITNQRNEQQVQQVQALDGSPAHIYVGQQRSQQGGYTTQTPQRSGTALTVTARLVGADQVMIVVDQDASHEASRNRREISSLHTEVTGRIGEWLSLGNTVISSSTSGKSLSGMQQGSKQRDNSISLRVERMD